MNTRTFETFNIVINDMRSFEDLARCAGFQVTSQEYRTLFEKTYHGVPVRYSDISENSLLERRTDDFGGWLALAAPISLITKAKCALGAHYGNFDFSIRYSCNISGNGEPQTLSVIPEEILGSETYDLYDPETREEEGLSPFPTDPRFMLLFMNRQAERRREKERQTEIAKALFAYVKTEFINLARG